MALSFVGSCHVTSSPGAHWPCSSVREVVHKVQCPVLINQDFYWGLIKLLYYSMFPHVVVMWPITHWFNPLFTIKKSYHPHSLHQISDYGTKDERSFFTKGISWHNQVMELVFSECLTAAMAHHSIPVSLRSLLYPDLLINQYKQSNLPRLVNLKNDPLRRRTLKCDEHWQK